MSVLKIGLGSVLGAIVGGGITYATSSKKKKNTNTKNNDDKKVSSTEKQNLLFGQYKTTSLDDQDVTIYPELDQYFIYLQEQDEKELFGEVIKLIDILFQIIINYKNAVKSKQMLQHNRLPEYAIVAKNQIAIKLDELNKLNYKNVRSKPRFEKVKETSQAINKAVETKIHNLLSI